MRCGILVITFLFVFRAEAQVFQLNGSAQAVGDDCYKLTNDVLWELGSMWHIETIDLNEDFAITFEVNLGCEDLNGADGIVFGLQNISTNVGEDGGGIGFYGINPSIGFEFDTYQNTGFNDPEYDHTALLLNGQIDHLASLAGPVPISPASNNVEDCSLHKVSIVWDTNSQNISLFYDCDERITYNIDLVNTVFAGDSEVFWGFTSATGGLSNEHTVCLDFFTNSLLDEEICFGDDVQLEATGGESYVWTPATGLSATDIPNPVASPSITTTYTVTILDACGIGQEDELTVFVLDETQIDLGEAISECAGNTVILDATIENATYEWSNGSNQAMIEVTEAGEYDVVVSVGSCEASASVSVSFEEEATESIDTLICEANLFFEGVNIPVNESETFSIVEDGCTTLLTINVLPDDCPDPCIVQVPTAFSPNNDGINDRFSVLGDCELILFKVLNRWGETIYESDNSQAHWDGTFQGTEQAIGQYVWFAETLDPATDELRSWAGNLTLIR